MKQLKDFPEVVAAQATFEQVQKKEIEHRNAMRKNDQMRSAIRANSSQRQSAVSMLLDENTPSLAERVGLEKEQQLLEQEEPLIAKAMSEARTTLEKGIGFASLTVCDEERPGKVDPIIAENLRLLNSLVENNQRLAAWREGLEERGFKTGRVPVCVVPNMEFIRDTYKRSIQQSFPSVR